MMKYIKALWQLCAYLLWPQMGRERRKMELLKKDITYLMGKERAEGNLEPLSAEYISRVLKVPVEEVEKCLKEMELTTSSRNDVVWREL